MVKFKKKENFLQEIVSFRNLLSQFLVHNCQVNLTVIFFSSLIIHIMRSVIRHCNFYAQKNHKITIDWENFINFTSKSKTRKIIIEKQRTSKIKEETKQKTKKKWNIQRYCRLDQF